MENLIILVQLHVSRTGAYPCKPASSGGEDGAGLSCVWLVFPLCGTDCVNTFFQINGTFQVNIPPILLGYTWSKTYMSPKEDYNGQNLKECTFLNIFATIEPQISYVTCTPELDKVCFTLNYFYSHYQRSIKYFKNQ